MSSMRSLRALTKPIPKLALVLFQVDMATGIVATKTIQGERAVDFEVMAKWGTAILRSKIVALSDDMTKLNAVDRDFDARGYISTHPWMSEDDVPCASGSQQNLEELEPTNKRKQRTSQSPSALVRYTLDGKTYKVSKSNIQGTFAVGQRVLARWRNQMLEADIEEIYGCEDMSGITNSESAICPTVEAELEVEQETITTTDLDLSEVGRVLNGASEILMQCDQLGDLDLGVMAEIPRIAPTDDRLCAMMQEFFEKSLENQERIIDELKCIREGMASLHTKIAIRRSDSRNILLEPPTSRGTVPANTFAIQTPEGLNETVLASPSRNATPLLNGSPRAVPVHSASRAPFQEITTQCENTPLAPEDHMNLGNLSHDPVFVRTDKYQSAVMKAKNRPMVLVRKLIDLMFSERELCFGNETGTGQMVQKDGTTWYFVKLDTAKLTAIRRAVELQFREVFPPQEMTRVIGEKIRKVRFEYKRKMNI